MPHNERSFMKLIYVICVMCTGKHSLVFWDIGLIV